MPKTLETLPSCQTDLLLRWTRINNLLITVQFDGQLYEICNSHFNHIYNVLEQAKANQQPKSALRKPIQPTDPSDNLAFPPIDELPLQAIDDVPLSAAFTE
jgi:hypothetical protein